MYVMGMQVLASVSNRTTEARDMERRAGGYIHEREE
jgi:hypothetical protein